MFPHEKFTTDADGSAVVGIGETALDGRDLV
jgi:hypothetical protein